MNSTASCASTTCDASTDAGTCCIAAMSAPQVFTSTVSTKLKIDAINDANISIVCAVVKTAYATTIEQSEDYITENSCSVAASSRRRGRGRKLSVNVDISSEYTVTIPVSVAIRTASEYASAAEDSMAEGTNFASAVTTEMGRPGNFPDVIQDDLATIRDATSTSTQVDTSTDSSAARVFGHCALSSFVCMLIAFVLLN